MLIRPSDFAFYKMHILNVEFLSFTELKSESSLLLLTEIINEPPRDKTIG